MSSFRLFGNAMLTGLSKFASGYWTVGDPQNGYTAISRETIEELDLESITDQYGFLNHILAHLNVNERRVADVSMSAVYGDEESSITYTSFIRYVSMLLLRSFCWRLNRRYVVEGFNPAVVFYAAGSAGLAGGVAGTITSLAREFRGKEGFTGVLASFVALLLGVVSLGVAIAMDAAENEALERTSYETTAAEHAAESADSSAPAGSNGAASADQDSSREPRTWSRIRRPELERARTRTPTLARIQARRNLGCRIGYCGCSSCRCNRHREWTRNHRLQTQVSTRSNVLSSTDSSSEPTATRVRRCYCRFHVVTTFSRRRQYSV